MRAGAGAEGGWGRRGLNNWALEEVPGLSAFLCGRRYLLREEILRTHKKDRVN